MFKASVYKVLDIIFRDISGLEINYKLVFFGISKKKSGHIF